MSAALDKPPPLEQGIRNQPTCGGTGWRYVGGLCLGWWERCKGCKGCEK